MREAGFYWVKHKGRWVVAEWEPRYGDWWLTGTDECFFDDEFDEMGEQPIRKD